MIVAAGTGADMFVAPEMAAFAARYGFIFTAHALGHANRSARVEAPFHRIEQAFLAGGQFADWQELKRRARETIEVWNARFSNKLHASRRELFAAEQGQLKALPLLAPPVYQLCERIVDAEGYVHLNRIRYSAPYALIGRMLEVRETMDRVDLYAGARRVASHARLLGPLDSRVTDPAHRPPRGQLCARRARPAPEEIEMLQIEPRLSTYLQALKRQIRDRRAPLRRLLSMLREYPREAFVTALASAERYRLFDLHRLEKMVLRQIAEDYFVLSLTPTESGEPDE